MQQINVTLKTGLILSAEGNGWNTEQGQQTVERKHASSDEFQTFVS
jgi:hypothetical protein